MRKLTPKGIIGLTTTAFLFFILTSLIYFNDQVEFNSVEAKWQLAENYQIKDSTIIEQVQDTYSLSFDGIDDYVLFDQSVNNLQYVEFLHTSDSILLSKYKISDNRKMIIQTNQTTGEIQLRYYYANPVRYNYYKLNVPLDTVVKIDIRNATIEYDNNIYNMNNYISSGITSYNVLDGYDIELQRTDDGSTKELAAIWELPLRFYDTSDNLIHEYLFNDGSGIILSDNISDNNGTINGATWVLNQSIISITQPGIDSYQVFENIRNNASTVNPLGFMNTLVSIPSQAVGYYDAFTDFVTGGFGIFDIPDMTFSELSDTWWARLPIIYDKFNERYGPLGD